MKLFNKCTQAHMYIHIQQFNKCLVEEFKKINNSSNTLNFFKMEIFSKLNV